MVNRDEILNAIWAWTSSRRATSSTATSGACAKLQNDYRNPRFIATVPGIGYRFIPTFSNLGWAGGSTTGGRAAS